MDNNNFNNYNNQPMGGMPNQQPMGAPNQGMNQGMNFGAPTNNGVISAPAENNFLSKLAKDKTSIIGYVGAAITAIGTFFPFATVTVLGVSESIGYLSNNGETADGVFVLLLMIATLVLIALKKNVFGIATTAIALIVFINNFVGMNDLKSSYSSLGYGSLVEIKHGAAIYIIIVGFLVLVAHFVLYIKQNPSCFKDLINKFKQPKQPMMNNNMNYGSPMNQMPNQNMQNPQNNPYQNNNNNNMF